jgi:hypothetical protein
MNKLYFLVYSFLFVKFTTLMVDPTHRGGVRNQRQKAARKSLNTKIPALRCISKSFPIAETSS